jgi:zinc transporter 9
VMMICVPYAVGVRLCSSRLLHHKRSTCCTYVCCLWQRCLTTTARLHQPSWHHHNQNRQLTSMRVSLVKLGRSQSSMLMDTSPRHLSTLRWQQKCFTSAPQSVNINLYSTNPELQSQSSHWKYHYSSDHRFFTSSKNIHDTVTNPLQSGDASQIESLDQLRSMVESETDQVPDDDLDTGKSQVNIETDQKLDAMKAQFGSEPKAPDVVVHTIQKTQDDFADYLKGEDPLLNELGIKKQNFAQNELKRQAKAGQMLDPLAALPDSPNAADSAAETNTMHTETNPATESDSPGTNFEYTFTSKDAILSGRERYERRRRAMEQKLEEQQAQSRAATYSNVQRALGGNAVIAVAKLAAAISSGSSAMTSEFVHSVVDCGNQALLLVGLKSSGFAADRKHPYGYGKAIYFWALVSALGTFFLGAGVSMTHAVGEFMNPHMTTEVPMEVWGVLVMSFAVDGYVFAKTIQGVMASKRIDGESKEMSFWSYAINKVRDPATLAVLLEDGAATLGVVIAIGGIGLTQYTGLPVCDAVAGMGISALLGAMGLALVKVNHRFLIGQGIDNATRIDIENIILSRRSIDNIYSVQSQWTGPDTFSYKAEVDFDGTFLAAKLLPRYQKEFFEAKETLDRDLQVLLSWYAEDVMRAAEREIRHIEEEIRMKYPAAQYIELEPMSKDADRYAVDDGMEAQLRRVELEALNRYLRSLYKRQEGEKE